jgi:hypothetical protein
MSHLYKVPHNIKDKEVIMETKSMPTYIHGVTLALDNNHKVEPVLKKETAR